MQPLFDKVLIGVEKAETMTTSGIILTRKEDEKLERAVVLALGDDCTSRVKVGDRVVLKGYSYDTITLDGEEFSFIKEEDILAICPDITMITE